MPPKSHFPLSSVMAKVAIVSPEAMPGRYDFLASSSPEVSSALAPSATDEKNGAHSSAAPISSKTTSSSTYVKPDPPNSSGMVSDCRPSWSAIWVQTAGSYPSSVSISRRTSDSGDFSARKRRTAVRSSSCSSLKAKFMPGLPLHLPAGGRLAACLPDERAAGPDVRRWGDGTAGADLERCHRRGPPDCGGTHGQQRLHPALPSHRRGHAD